MSANSEHETASNIDIRNATEKTRRYVYDDLQYQQLTVLETLPQNRKHGSKFPSPKAKTFIPKSVNTNHVLSLDQPNEHVLNPTVVLQPEHQQKIHAVHDESRENAQFSQLTTIFCKRIYVVKNN